MADARLALDRHRLRRPPVHPGRPSPRDAEQWCRGLPAYSAAD